MKYSHSFVLFTLCAPALAHSVHHTRQAEVCSKQCAPAYQVMQTACPASRATPFSTPPCICTQEQYDILESCSQCVLGYTGAQEENAEHIRNDGAVEKFMAQCNVVDDKASPDAKADVDSAAAQLASSTVLLGLGALMLL